MGIKQSKDFLKPTTLTFGGDDTLPDFPNYIHYNDDEELTLRKNPMTNDGISIKSSHESEPNINEYLHIEDKIKINSKLELKSLNSSKKFPSNSPLHMLTTLNIDSVTSNSRTSIDLICVIDRSWSMKGEKLNLVKESLNYLLMHLNENDRLCIIVFDDEIERLCPLSFMNSENKIKIQEKISKIVAKGGTRIASAMQHAIEVLKQRRYINSVTSVFLLSDGNDLNADKKIKNLLDKEKYFNDKKDSISISLLPLNSLNSNSFTINTFGYGNDHDAKLMMNISRLSDGNFYYVDDIHLIDECFLGCLAGLVSVIAQDLTLTIRPKRSLYKIIPKFEDIEKYHMYNSYDGSYSIRILQLISGRSYNFLLDIEMNCENIFKQKDFIVDLCEITCTFQGVRESGYKIITLYSKCSVMLLNGEDNVELVENVNQDVIFHYLRVKSGEILREAKILSDEGKFNEAKMKIDLENKLFSLK
jgi:Mg-chelatase subunit ChlD